MFRKDHIPKQGFIYGDLVLVWGRPIDDFTLFLGKVKRVSGFFVNSLASLFVLTGMAAFGLRVAERPFMEVFSSVFWMAGDVRMLAFWFGVINLSFLYYRAVLAAQERETVRQRVYGEAAGDDVREASFEELAGPRDRRIDIAKAFSVKASKAVDEAYALARRSGHVEASPAHLFAALLSDKDVAIAFGRLGLPFATYRDELGRLLDQSAPGDMTVLSDATHGVLARAYAEARKQRLGKVGPLELLLAAVSRDTDLQEMLYAHEVDARKVENVVRWIRVQERMRAQMRRFSRAASLRPKNTMNRAMTAVATPFLDRLGEDLTRAAAMSALPPITGREREFDAVFRAIEGGHRSVVLVGKRGVGKEAVIEGIAQRMVEEQVPAALSDARLVTIDVARLVAGVTAAEAQERLLTVFYEVARARNVVLVVQNIGGMIGVADGEGIDLSQTFAAELQRGYVFAITTATPDEYAERIERSALGGALVKVDIPEPETDDAIQILQVKAGNIEYRNGVFFSYDAIEAAVTLSARYLHDRQLPEKAIEVASEAASAARSARGKDAVVSREDVAAIVSEKASIPLTKLTDQDSEKLLNLEEVMHARVIGQDQAVTAIASAMRRAGASLRTGTRPIANFLFVGPTGVGKTELAKTLAEAYFSGEDAMIRLDMSEYQDPSAINKLIGGSNDRSGGLLTEAVRRKPFALLLLDEIEKAHPDVLTAFLQVMDDGRLTDNAGRTVDFTNIILIATSNVGSAEIQEAVREGVSPEVLKERLVNGGLKERFRPEFLNRFDDIVMFTPLTREETEKITRLMLAHVVASLEEKGIGFLVTDAAVAELADAGFDPAFGARPLRRVIQDRVENKVADIILKGEAGRRDTIIYDVQGAVTVEKAEKL